MTLDTAALTQRQKLMWAAGDYADIARTIEPVARELLDAVGVQAGEALLGRHMPPPPEGFRPPILWGVEDAVRQLFVDAAEVRCELLPATDSVKAPTVEDWIDYTERVLGPTILAKAALEAQGRWAAARADLIELYERFNEAGDGSLLAHPTYLLTVATAK